MSYRQKSYFMLLSVKTAQPISIVCVCGGGVGVCLWGCVWVWGVCVYVTDIKAITKMWRKIFTHFNRRRKTKSESKWTLHVHLSVTFCTEYVFLAVAWLSVKETTVCKLAVTSMRFSLVIYYMCEPVSFLMRVLYTLLDTVCVRFW